MLLAWHGEEGRNNLLYPACIPALLVSRSRPIFTKQWPFPPSNLKFIKSEVNHPPQIPWLLSTALLLHQALLEFTWKPWSPGLWIPNGSFQALSTFKPSAGMIWTALSTLTKSITAVYSEQGTSQSRIIWGAEVGKVSMDRSSWKVGDGHSSLHFWDPGFPHRNGCHSITVSNVRYREIKVLRFHNHVFVWSYVFPLVFLRKGAASHDIIRSAASLFTVSLCWLHISQPLHYESCLFPWGTRDHCWGSWGFTRGRAEPSPSTGFQTPYRRNIACFEKPGHSFLPPALWAPSVPPPSWKLIHQRNPNYLLTGLGTE